MSHVCKVDFEFKDLESLKRAALDVGCEFVEDKTFNWFKTHVGDYPLPEGFTREDMGKCDVGVIRVKNASAQTYEVGVCSRRDGKKGYTLLFDFWQGGYGLEKAIGSKADKLKQAYAVRVNTKTLQREGFRVKRTVDAQGRVHLRAN